MANVNFTTDGPSGSQATTEFTSGVAQDSDNALFSLLQGFFKEYEMLPVPSIRLGPSPFGTAELKTFLCEELERRHLPRDFVDLAASLAGEGFHVCPFPVKQYIVLYMWHCFYLDHTCPEDFSGFMPFQERFLKNLPQLDPFLHSLATTLHAAFDFYPASSANILIQGAFDFITGCSIEHAIQKQPLTSVSPRFPWFLRYRTGFGMAVALMLFPKSHNLNIGYMDIFPALADMDFWISACNDLISYYKESRAGEKANYISLRAAAEGKAALEVLVDVGQETVQSRKRILDTLEDNIGREAVDYWQAFEKAYLTWHFQEERYRLREIGF